MERYIERSWTPAMFPRICQQDRGIARRCKLFLGTELERGAPVLEDLFVWPPMERRREFVAANPQAESYLEREHNARWTALRVAHATSGITANVLTLLLPLSIFAHSSTDHIPHSEFFLLTLIGTAFPKRNEMRTHLCLGSREIAQWIVRAAAALSLRCTYMLIHRYLCLLLL